MSEINILSPHVADLIAAGEVVERPASVIKELVENSFDAGAQNITIEIKGGGMTYIRVTDDGCGMLPEDAGLCFLRHATSKLRDERGLESIGTMGFRGEALAAIASVARVELQTRKKSTENGIRVVLEAGEIMEMTPIGCPDGTTMIIRDLFFNTPARLKFMKTDRAEGSSCALLALRCALGRPEVSVRMLKDGDEEFFSPGDGKIGSCVYSLLGRDTAKELLECGSSEDGLSVSGFVGSPNAGHGNRGRQFFFCNGRCIRSQLLQTAVEQAYKNTLLTGRYPSCVVYLELSPGAVDVNVHPAKTEVKFREERHVFDAVYYAARSAIEGEGRAAEISLSPSTKATIAPKKEFFKSMSTEEYREKMSGGGKGTAYPYPSRPMDKPVIHAGSPIIPAGSSDRGTIVWSRNPAVTSDDTSFRTIENPYKSSVEAAAIEAVFAPPVEADAVKPLSEAVSSYRLVGEAMKTYIIVEREGELLLIDKHAAHERMIFDRLKAQGLELMSQSLLIPITMKLHAEEIELIEQNSDLLSGLGFEIEPYGEDSVILRGVPTETDAADAPAMVEEVCEKIKKGSSLSKSDAMDEILHTVACKAAIKAGWNTAEAELNDIVKEVVSGRIKYCPHGRPVSITLTKKQLDKEFSRIV